MNTPKQPAPLDLAQSMEELLMRAEDENARQREQIAALREALNGLLPMFDNDNPLLTVYVAEIEQARAALVATKEIP